MAASESNAAMIAASERRRAVEKLYFDNFRFIEELANSDRAGTFAEAQTVIEGIARHLTSYPDELTDAAFQSWLRDAILPLLAFNEIRRTCDPYVKEAIWRILGPCADLGVTPDILEDAEQHVWLWAVQNLDSLCDPKAEAKPKTRLYSKAKFAALTIRKQLLRARERFGAGVDVNRIGTELDNPFDRLPALVIEPLRKKDADPYERVETVGVSRP